MTKFLSEYQRGERTNFAGWPDQPERQVRELQVWQRKRERQWVERITGVEERDVQKEGGERWGAPQDLELYLRQKHLKFEHGIGLVACDGERRGADNLNVPEKGKNSQYLTRIMLRECPCLCARVYSSIVT